MIRMPLLFVLTVVLVGCGSISHPLPKCDGYSRRPLNRSMWQWQGDGQAKSPATSAVHMESVNKSASYAEENGSAVPAAFANFDVAGSYRPCEGR
ncbi:hypothetical protein [Rhizobium etli]|uniref:hypothetical protein n=1 Tax=Rhizobium etli TaxID=29449 RepID=UPI000383914A|nr:hypothetical protein [Rhizobium etli]AGS26441.1 type IV secretion system lipoprotein VirB7 [Rhizobium etli bv. mimosae str. Mim1]